MQQSEGVLLVVSGPSGAGKSTVIHRLFEKRDDVCFSVSVTTRSPREGERDGVDYYFRSKEEFERMIEEDAFLEYAVYTGACYGTPAEPVLRKLEEGKHLILDIEVQGASQVMEKMPDAVSVFLCPPSLEELERRLRGRGTDPEDKIRARLDTARTEYKQAHKYDYIVINEDADKAADQLNAILTAAGCRSTVILKGDPLL